MEIGGVGGVVVVGNLLGIVAGSALALQGEVPVLFQRTDVSNITLFFGIVIKRNCTVSEGAFFLAAWCDFDFPVIGIPEPVKIKTFPEQNHSLVEHLNVLRKQPLMTQSR